MTELDNQIKNVPSRNKLVGKDGLAPLRTLVPKPQRNIMNASPSAVTPVVKIPKLASERIDDSISVQL